MKQTASQLIKEMKAQSSPTIAKGQMRFFKTGPGQYGEGDHFIGIKVPSVRKICRQYKDLPHTEIVSLLNSPLHEIRLAGLILLTEQSRRSEDPTFIRANALFAWKNRKALNNWDLVSVSVPILFGRWLAQEEAKKTGFATAWCLERIQSKSLWERRVGVLSTFYFIRQNIFHPTTAVCAGLLHDEHDLIHKATGWMLRELGKKSEKDLDRFLKRFASQMPRTMLRYAIEKKSAPERLRWLGRKSSG